MDSKHRTSVIAKLMGFDELSPPQPVKKRQRVFSDNYISKVSSIAVRVKRPFHRDRSFRLSIEEGEEIKDAFGVAEKIKRDADYKKCDNGVVADHNGELGTCNIPKFLGSPNNNGISETNLGKTARRTNISIPFQNSHSTNEKKKESKETDTQTADGRNCSCRKASKSESRNHEFSLANSCQKTQNHLLFNRSGVSFVVSKARNKITDGRRRTEKSQEYRGHRRGRTVVEMLALPPHRSRRRNFNCRFHDYAARNRNGFHDKQQFTVPLRSSKQHCNLNGLESRFSGSSCDKSCSFSCGGSENSILVQKSITLQCELKRKLEQEDPQKQSYALTNAETELLPTTTENHKECHFHLMDSTLLVDNDGSFSQAQQDMSSSICEEDSILPFCSCTGPEPPGPEETCHPSPNSVLDPIFEEGISCRSGYFHGVNAKLHGLQLQLELLKSVSSDASSEGVGMMVSSDDESEEAFSNKSRGRPKLMKIFSTQESRDFSYLVDILTEAGHERNTGIAYDTWYSPECPISTSVFEALEKKYGEQVSWKRSERKLLFDRINSLLREILQPSVGILSLRKPVSRKLGFRSIEAVEEEVWKSLVVQEKRANRDSSVKVAGNDDGWLELDDDFGSIGREIEDSLIDELVTEVISFESS